MRLSFANGEHADVVVEGVASLGSAEDNTLVLAGRDVAAHHARLNVDARGIVLEVLDPAARTHVNARPVRERALLHLGDVLCLGRLAITLKADRDDSLEAPPSAAVAGAPQEPAAVILRGVAGSHFGRAVAVNPRLVVGRGADCDLRIDDPLVAHRHAVIEAVDQSIRLREGASEALRVNGIATSAALVYPGDQLTFGRSQFLIEAPGWPSRDDAADPARHAITETTTVVADAASAQVASRHQGLWWLLAAAALIALGFALLLQQGP